MTIKMKINKAGWLVGVFLLALVAGGTAQRAQAQTKENGGTAGATYLLVPGTARSASLGTTLTSGLPTLNGVEALYENPAGLVSNMGTSVLVSRMNYAVDIGVNTFGVAQRIGSNQVALTVNVWDYGDIALQTDASPEKTELTWSASAIVAGLSYARQFTDRIAAGVTFKALSERIDDVNAGGIAFDAGMNYTVGESGLRFGVSLKNLGPQMTYAGDGLSREIRLPEQRPGSTSNVVQIEAAGFELPSLLNFGVSYTRPLGAGASATFLGNFRSNSLDQDLYAGGVELGLREILYVRGSYEWQPDMDLTMFDGWNMGAGLNLEVSGTRLMVDYAYRPTNFFGSIQMVTASVEL